MKNKTIINGKNCYWKYVKRDEGNYRLYVGDRNVGIVSKDSYDNSWSALYSSLGVLFAFPHVCGFKTREDASYYLVNIYVEELHNNDLSKDKS